MQTEGDAINKYGPRSGKPVQSDSLTRYRGVVVGFCNPGCRDDFAGNGKGPYQRSSLHRRPHHGTRSRSWIMNRMRTMRPSPTRDPSEDSSRSSVPSPALVTREVPGFRPLGYTRGTPESPLFPSEPFRLRTLPLTNKPNHGPHFSKRCPPTPPGDSFIGLRGGSIGGHHVRVPAVCPP